MEADAARPSFHDGALRRTLDEVGGTIESFAERLDKLSADIKQLEAYLDRSGVRVRVAVFVDGRNRESVSWERAEPDRWRVTYTEMQADELGLACPLIEAPVDVRLRCRRILPDLLRAVAEAARTDDEATVPPTDDDIPF